MTLQSNSDAIPFCIAAMISVVLALLAWRRGTGPTARAFTVMMAGETIWALFESLELVIADAQFKLVCIEIRVLGAVTTILGLLAFVLSYTGRGRWLEARRFGAICAPALALILVAWTNPWHHRYWFGHENRLIGGFRIAVPSYGPGFWLHFGYCYVLVAASTLLLAGAAIRAKGVFRAQAAVMLFGVLLPWIVNVIDMSQVFGFIHVDTAAMTFAITGLAFLPGLFRLRLLDLTPVAWAVVVRGMNDPVVVIDPWRRIIELTRAAERLVGRKSGELLGHQLEFAFRDWPALVDRLERIEEQVEPSFELDGPDGVRPSIYDARISRLDDGTGPPGWVLVLRELTEHKRAEDERIRMLSERAARAEAEAANRAKDLFLATLSHELRTPLTPVLATVTAMLDDRSTPSAFRTVLEMIRRNVVLEARLIDDLLDLTRIRGGKLHLKREIIDAHELVNQVIEICGGEIQAAQLGLFLELEARRHHVDADPARLQQVLWNLIKNAIKFTPPGGAVTVRSRNRDEETFADDARLIIEVSDTGIGITPEVLPRIFDIFEQGGVSATRQFGGLGLGLTISRSIAEHHGGRLVASSRGPGLGATLALELHTAAVPTAAIIEESPAPRASSPKRSFRILLVDDNQDTLNYLSKILTLRGYDVLTASDLATAYRVASESDFELLISDIELPDGTGLELIGALRQSRDVSGIALSGFGSSDDIELSLSAGFSDHLTKPVDFRRLEEAIQTLAADSTSSSLIHH